MNLNTLIAKFYEWINRKNSIKISSELRDIPIYDWQGFSKEIHQVNLSKGFWGEEPSKRNVGEALNLIHDEISEAVMVRYSLTPDSKVPQIDEFTAEISDVMIRTLDLCAFFGAELESPTQSATVFEKNLDTNLLLLGLSVSDVSEAHRKGDDIVKELESLFVSILLFAFVHRIDLWKSCNLKVAFNKTRPFLHGKKY
jgi:hypothetical protein